MPDIEKEQRVFIQKRGDKYFVFAKDGAELVRHGPFDSAEEAALQIDTVSAAVRFVAMPPKSGDSE